MSRAGTPNVLVVCESNSAFPSWLSDCSRYESRVVVFQREFESPVELCRRIEGIEHELAWAGAGLEVAVIACSERHDPFADEARRRLARSLLRALKQPAGGRLFLTASDRSSGKSRHGLSQLAQDLDREYAEEGVSVRVRFSSEDFPIGNRDPDLPHARDGLAPRRRNHAA